jgi:hypothetical protein
MNVFQLCQIGAGRCALGRAVLEIYSNENVEKPQATGQVLDDQRLQRSNGCFEGEGYPLKPPPNSSFSGKRSGCFVFRMRI